MVGRQTQIGPRLQALLDERDDLRVKINLAENSIDTVSGVGEMRRQLVDLDRRILKHWEKPEV
jgi:hypothetical protein